MSKLYACVISHPLEVTEEFEGDQPREGSLDTAALSALASQFAYRIELIENGVLFDISGLEKRLGSPSQISQSVLREMQVRKIDGSLAIAANASTAELYARTKPGVTVVEMGEHQELPLDSIGIDADTLNVFHALGMETTADLRSIPEDELIARYGGEFRKTLDLINQNGTHILTPNLKENKVVWDYDLDFPVEDFEQLLFILGHGLGKVLDEAGRFGFSSERIDITLQLDTRTTAEYNIHLSFPTRDRPFWLKLINLRIGNEPPEGAIVSMCLVCHFARPRAIERGLFAATRPEPESLLLTIDKIKKIVGPSNVGVPALVDQRLPEAFELDPHKIPIGKEHPARPDQMPVLALTHFHPPVPADIHTSGDRLVYLKTQHFSGSVTEYGGAWVQSSQWWTRGFWQQMEWDVEIDSRRIYRLARTRGGWFVTGGYD